MIPRFSCRIFHPSVGVASSDFAATCLDEAQQQTEGVLSHVIGCHGRLRKVMVVVALSDEESKAYIMPSAIFRPTDPLGLYLVSHIKSGIVEYFLQATLDLNAGHCR